MTTLGLKGLPIKPDAIKASAASLDDFTETARKLVVLEDLPTVDMVVRDEEKVGENLEGDDEDEDGMEGVVTNGTATKTADEEEEDEADPLDAFMSGVNAEVTKVNLEDKVKFGADRMEMDTNDDGAAAEDETVAVPDELDTTNLRPEDILA